MKCQRMSCKKEAAPNHAYCSPECAPYGYRFDAEYLKKKKIESGNMEHGEHQKQRKQREKKTPIDAEKDQEMIRNIERENRRESAPGMQRWTKRRNELEGVMIGRNCQIADGKKSIEDEANESNKIHTEPKNKGDITMPDLKTTDARNVSVETEGIQPESSNGSLVHLDREISHSKNIVQNSIQHLHDLMKDLKPMEKNGGCIKEPLSPLQINTACNIAKNIAGLVRLQVDMFREIRKYQDGVR